VIREHLGERLEGLVGAGLARDHERGGNGVAAVEKIDAACPELLQDFRQGAAGIGRVGLRDGAGEQRPHGEGHEGDAARSAATSGRTDGREQRQIAVQALGRCLRS